MFVNDWIGLDCRCLVLFKPYYKIIVDSFVLQVDDEYLAFVMAIFPEFSQISKYTECYILDVSSTIIY